MNSFRELWKNKLDADGRVNITVFFANIFLLLSHIVLMFIYLKIGHKFMIYANIVSIIIYACQINTCYKYIETYSYITFSETWIHMVLATITFGWALSFQNWSFALVAAYFLPAFSKKSNFKRSIVFSSIVIMTYFLLAVLTFAVDYRAPFPINDTIKKLIFVLNNGFAFFSITMFALFYTLKARRKERELTRKADFDELTGIYNRYAINQISDRVINIARKNNLPYNVAIVDIDFFKKVNDTYGHTSGDMVLKKLADILKQITSNDITVGRWGGEEFIIIASSNIKYTDFKNILKKLRLKINKQKFRIEGKKSINITVSMGAASVKVYESIEDAIGVADENLYKAKETGRNKIVG